jgi:hypothetical protein
MGQGRRHFTDEFKEEAIALLVSSGRPLRPENDAVIHSWTGPFIWGWVCRPGPSISRDRKFADSPLEGTGFELAVPRRNESRDRPVLLALWGLADDERHLVLARYPPRVVTLSLCRRRHEAADLGREQPGEFDRCRVLALRPDDLQGDR